VWSQAVALLDESGLVSEELGPTSISDQQRQLGEGVRELLHGTGHYEQRFDRFVSRLESVFDKPPSWEAASALPALFSPLRQVYVEPISFRKQLKALARPSALSARPTGAAYLRCLGMARSLASMLAAQGEVPKDLLEVHDFIRATTR
jgi:hypothetical protein